MIGFDSIFGQDSALDQLRRSYLADRLPHGLIFSGPQGVGKATTARALSAVFLCEKPNGDLPCGKCGSCGVFESGNHPDYHIITKELIRFHDKTGKSKGIDLSIHVIRPEVVEKAAMMSVMGRGKVFVIEQADVMNAAAQNSLLKTLEEPAGRTLIILLTDQAGAMLPTIRSRCQLISFASLDVKLVISELQKRGIDASTARDAVHFAGGSLGVALRWIEDGVIGPSKELTKQLDAIFSGRKAADLSEFFKSAADAYAEKQMERDELGSKDQATREGLTLYLRLAADHVRHLMTQRKDAGQLEQLCAGIDSIFRAEQYLDGNVNIALLLQQLSLSLEQPA